MPTCADGVRSGWCALCYSGRRGRAVYKGHYGYAHVEGRKWSLRMSLLRRSARPTEQAPPPLPTGSVAVVSCLPALMEFLTLGKWDDGAKRLLGTISVFWKDGSFKSWVNDKDGSRSACVSAPSFDELLLLVERKLTEESLEWRADPASFQRGKRN